MDFPGPHLPPKEKLVGVTIRLPPSVWKEARALAKAKGYSLSELFQVLVPWAVHTVVQNESGGKDRR